MRPVPNGRVVPSDAEVAANLRAEGFTGSDIDKRLAARAEANAKAQADYNAHRTGDRNAEKIKADAARHAEDLRRERKEADNASG
jgi:hypothetical protein